VNRNHEEEQNMRIRKNLAGLVLTGAVLTGALAWTSVAGAQDAAQAPEARIDAVKQSLASSSTALKTYEWIETMSLAVSGEEKVRQQYRCYHGADGAMQKVPVAADAKEEKKRGIKGKVADKKKAEFEASLKGAAALLQKYAPLEADKIQAAKAAGNVSVSLPAANGAVNITIKNYLQPGDLVTIEISAKNTINMVSVNTSMDQEGKKSPVTVKVTYGALTDGSLYPAKEVLEISAQGLKVDIQNSGYKKMAS
jgi:hypothetical protein